MKGIIKWILSAFIGVVISFVLVLINESLHILITCSLVAYAVSAILYYGIFDKSDMKLLVSIFSFIVVFILYFILYNHVNENIIDFGLFPFLVFLAHILSHHMCYLLSHQMSTKHNSKMIKIPKNYYKYKNRYRLHSMAVFS